MSSTRLWTCVVCEMPGDHCGCGVDQSVDRCGGRWTIRGTRIWARIVLHMKPNMVARLYPHITREQIAKVERWIDGGGIRLLEEEETREAIGDLASATELAQLVKIYLAHGKGKELFREAVVKAADRAWEETASADCLPASVSND